VKRKKLGKAAPAVAVNDTSDEALLDLLKRLQEANDIATIRQLSDQIERVVFREQIKHV
jgi:hypothetical protein